jgi:hypothetical protein
VTCKGPLCSNKVVAKGLCATHYKQLKRKGVLTPVESGERLEDRFWKYIDKKTGLSLEGDPCWIWTGTKDGAYGRMYYGNKSYSTHRWSFEQHKHVTLSRKDTLDHKCRNTLCCNPNHLEKVSLIENIERQHLYHSLTSEIERVRAFIAELGYDPDTLK